MEMNEMLVGNVHVWWRNIRRLPVEISEKVEMDGIENNWKVEIDGEIKTWRVEIIGKHK